MVRTIKAVAIALLIATASIAVIVFGFFIGALLLFLAGVAGVGGLLYLAWLIVKENQDEGKS